MNKFVDKYRPRFLTEIIGQDTIVKRLQDMILNKKAWTNHYLMEGEYGTGKTSMSRILAKALMCPDRKETDGCGVCEVCKSVDNNESMNYIELDAATQRSIDDMRGIKKDSTFLPIGRAVCRVFAIDEAHRLAADASRALLKTLEEGSGANFIFITTDLGKIVSQIKSRLVKLHFNLISQKDTVNYLKNISIQEKLKFEDQALEHISSMAQGHLRDAVKYLDICSNDLTLKNVTKQLGILDKNLYYSIINAIQDRENITKIMKQIKDNQCEMPDVVRNLMNLLTSAYRKNWLTGFNKRQIGNMLMALYIYDRNIATSGRHALLFEILLYELQDTYKTGELNKVQRYFIKE